MSLCLQNARALLREARVLRQSRAHKRALVLAALSMEEAGKVVFLAIASHSDWGDMPQDARNRLWRQFLSHKAKLWHLMNPAWKSVLYVRKRKFSHVPKALLRQVKRLEKAYARVGRYLKRLKVETIADLKVRCLYVDADKRTEKISPPCDVPPEVTTDMLTIADSGIKDAQKLRDTYRRSDTNRLVEAITVVTFRTGMLQDALEELNREENNAQ